MYVYNDFHCVCMYVHNDLHCGDLDRLERNNRTLPYVAQYSAIHCNTLHHTATHCTKREHCGVEFKVEGSNQNLGSKI